MAEHTEKLTCPRGHTHEVHWEDEQKAPHWECPDCSADPDVDDPSVPFEESR